MKKRGFTLIETITVVAIIGVIMLIISPMISSFIKSQDRLYNQSKVDGRLNEVVDFIKRDTRNAKKDSKLGGNPIGVFDSDGNLITNGSTGTTVVIKTVDSDGKDKYVQYKFVENKLNISAKSTYSSLGVGKTILNNVKIAEFKYEDNILLFYFKIDIPKRLEGKIRNEVRDVGITRINYQ